MFFALSKHFTTHHSFGLSLGTTVITLGPPTWSPAVGSYPVPAIHQDHGRPTSATVRYALALSRLCTVLSTSAMICRPLLKVCSRSCLSSSCMWTSALSIATILGLTSARNIMSVPSTARCGLSGSLLLLPRTPPTIPCLIRFFGTFLPRV